MTRVALHLLRVGACRHLECMAARGGRFAKVDFPSLCGLIQHPTLGWTLFDTGYAHHFFDATEPWPERLYRSLLPVNLPPHEVLRAQLAGHGLVPEDIATVIVSHYHGDHIAGLRDFPNAVFLALKADTEAFKSLLGQRWRATATGHLPALLPPDYFERLTYADHCASVDLPAWLAPFERGLDLLGDGSLIGVPLPGHSQAQLGVFMPDANGRPAFLVADACWSLPALLEHRLPSRLTLLVTAERRAYEQTFMGLAELARRESALAVLPSHCSSAWKAYTDGL